MGDQNSRLPCCPLKYFGVFGPNQASILNPQNIKLWETEQQPPDNSIIEVFVSGKAEHFRLFFSAAADG